MLNDFSCFRPQLRTEKNDDEPREGQKKVARAQKNVPLAWDLSSTESERTHVSPKEISRHGYADGSGSRGRSKLQRPPFFLVVVHVVPNDVATNESFGCTSTCGWK
mmetsp:Transcript_24152/g.49835  ORF Transcript_24152/g.49835 Transcript_24152/m.49835 type:complete len:106 (+) Transcript_24152:99-416(+)